MARLVANIPVLKSGYPPILIPAERREEYIRMLWEIDMAAGRAAAGSPLMPPDGVLSDFKNFCSEAWNLSKNLVAGGLGAPERSG